MGSSISTRSPFFQVRVAENDDPRKSVRAVMKDLGHAGI
jgi:hypothetical protein